MAERPDKKTRRDGVRGSLMQRRAARRAERRMRADTEPENARPSLGERLGWTLRETGWSLQERLIWPVTDWLRDGLDAAIWPFERAAWTVRKHLVWPLQDALSSPTGGKARVPRAATVGVIGALAIGSLGAGALVASGSGDDAATEKSAVVVAQANEAEPEPAAPILAKTEPEPEGPVLKGVRPSFGAKSDQERKAAKDALRQLESKQASADRGGAGQGANTTDSGDSAGKESAQANADEPSATPEAEGSADESSPASDPVTGATASNAEAAADQRRKESPLNVAERFAVAFVSYEVGTSGRPVNAVFRDTAEKDLLDSLRQRPPRQPTGAKVPKARVMNVVGGPRKKESMEVSVGLLRVDGVSELRLEMKKIDRGWVVKTVRG